MGIRSNTIPFALNPKYWTVSGQDRLVAEARYTLTGEDLDRRLVEIYEPEPRSPESLLAFKRANIDLDFKYGKITAYDHAVRLLDLDHPNKKAAEYRKALLNCRYEHGDIEDKEYDLAVCELEHLDHKSERYLLDMAAIKFKYDEFDQHGYDKECATITGEPWVAIIKAEIDYAESGNGFQFELDWNELFIEELMRNGWHGHSPEEIVDNWFTQTCQDTFNMDPEYQMDEPMLPTATTRAQRDGDRTEFS